MGSDSSSSASTTNQDNRIVADSASKVLSNSAGATLDESTKISAAIQEGSNSHNTSTDSSTNFTTSIAEGQNSHNVTNDSSTKLDTNITEGSDSRNTTNSGNTTITTTDNGLVAGAFDFLKNAEQANTDRLNSMLNTQEQLNSAGIAAQRDEFGQLIQQQGKNESDLMSGLFAQNKETQQAIGDQTSVLLSAKQAESDNSTQLQKTLIALAAIGAGIMILKG
jgi:hypothetical protein